MTIINSVDFESVLSLIDKTIEPLYLSSTQEIVLRETWNGKTYSEIACEHNYDSEYIKTVGCNLWQNLSSAFNEQINKSNFVPLMRQRTIKFLDQERPQPLLLQAQSATIEVKAEEPEIEEVQNYQLCHWTTAPHIENFIGREAEFKVLESWSQEPECNCIVVSGMVGCGKTTLVTKFAHEVKDQFDYVIWFSFLQTPSLETLLINYLELTNENPDEFSNALKPTSLQLNFLLPEFIDRLKQKKILLVIDDLQCILTNSRVNATYRQTFKEYGQFLRAIVSTSHRSLLIATSLILPTMLEYYSSSQVKFLNLDGFDFSTTKMFLNEQSSNLLNEKIVLNVSKNLQNNPQLLKISSNYLRNFHTSNTDDLDNTEEILHDLSLLEGIINLLERELQYLSDLNQEIICWLAISGSPLSLKELNQNLEISQRRVELLQSIEILLNRALVIKFNETYCLMPIMKIFLRRKLVKTALKSNNP
ncbi:MAG: AAA family ATPase [Hydrococcus sp. SU_1_0]|nr:AAA family ATPase [Hydrococcus sp. SU_1_0]